MQNKLFKQMSNDISAAWQKANQNRLIGTTRPPLCDLMAEELIKKYSLKLPEGVVVITSEEYEELIGNKASDADVETYISLAEHDRQISGYIADQEIWMARVKALEEQNERLKKLVNELNPHGPWCEGWNSPSDCKDCPNECNKQSKEGKQIDKQKILDEISSLLLLYRNTYNEESIADKIYELVFNSIL